MMLEPINSAMTFTAQPVAQSMSAPQPTAKSAEEFTEGSSQNVAQPVDNITLTVNATEAKDGDSNAQTGSNNNNSLAQQQSELNAKKIKDAVEEMNKKMSNSEAQFGIHEATNRVTIKIVDKKTKEIIKELPPEKTLDMIAKVWEMAGILVDEKR